MTVSDTERLTKYADASDTEKRLSETVADELGTDPTYTDERGNEWPIVQRVGSKSYAFWLDEYGVLGSVGEEEEKWATAHAEDGDLIEEGFDNVRDAALAAADLESET